MKTKAIYIFVFLILFACKAAYAEDTPLSISCVYQTTEGTAHTLIIDLNNKMFNLSGKLWPISILGYNVAGILYMASTDAIGEPGIFFQLLSAAIMGF